MLQYKYKKLLKYAQKAWLVLNYRVICFKACVLARAFLMIKINNFAVTYL